MASGKDLNNNHELMLNLYLHDYLLKKKMNTTAAIFKRETEIPNHKLALDVSPPGFLHEWWSTIWDTVVANKYYECYKDKPKKTVDQKMQMEERREAQSSLSAESHLATALRIYEQSLQMSEDKFDGLLEPPAAIVSEWDYDPSFGPLLNKPNLPFSPGMISSSRDGKSDRSGSTKPL